MRNRIGDRLNFAKRAMLAGKEILALAMPIALGFLNTTTARAQSSKSGPATTRPKLEVASIRPCQYTPPSQAARGGTAGGGVNQSTDRIAVPCSSVLNLIQMAYSRDAEGRIAQIPIQGVPSWTNSEYYVVVAKAEDRATGEMLRGPLLQALLEDRFKLKIRRETQEMPVYKLIVAKGGLKLPPFKEGSCWQISEGPPPPGEEYCVSMAGPKGPNFVIERQGTTLENFARINLIGLGRPVIDETGITGRFDIHLEFAPGDNAPRPRIQGDAGEPTAPEIFTALQEQLGLKLEPGKGPSDVLVIDYVERPSEN